MNPKVIEVAVRYFTNIVTFRVDFGSFVIEITDYDLCELPIKDEILIQIALDHIKSI